MPIAHPTHTTTYSNYQLKKVETILKIAICFSLALSVNNLHRDAVEEGGGGWGGIRQIS